MIRLFLIIYKFSVWKEKILLVISFFCSKKLIVVLSKGIFLNKIKLRIKLIKFDEKCRNTNKQVKHKDQETQTDSKKVLTSKLTCINLSTMQTARSQRRLNTSCMCWSSHINECTCYEVVLVKLAIHYMKYFSTE